jgi:predicted Fe-S protein YdhL (DUF1289 family)
MAVESPCIDRCQLDDGICLGCGRTIDEITGWQRLSERQKEQVIDAIADREYPKPT